MYNVYKEYQLLSVYRISYREEGDNNEKENFYYKNP